MGCGTVDVNADSFVPHKGPPQTGQHHQLQRNSNGEVADKPILGSFHTLTGIKMRATPAVGKNCL